MSVSTKPLKTRRQRREYRISNYWDDKTQAAPDEQARAAVQFDRLRTEISRLPEERRAAAWQAASEDLARIRREIAGR